MEWQEKLKEYNTMQVIKQEEEKKRALRNIVRDIEKNKLDTMWKLLNIDGKEETEKTYILEALSYFEAQRYDKETGNTCLCMIPEGIYESFETKQDAEYKAKIREQRGYTTKIYHLSIRDIEDMLRQIDREDIAKEERLE